MDWIFFFINLLFVIFLFIFFNKLIINIFKKSDVVVYDTISYIEKPPSVNLTCNNFYVGFALEDPETYDFFIDETVYYIKAFFKEGKRIEGIWNWKIRQLELEKCKLEKFGKPFQDKFKTNALDYLYCFKEINETLFGHFSYDTYSLFFIQLFPCKNTTENNNHCKPREYIDKYLNGTYFAMEFEDVELTPQNYTTPARPRNQDVYFTVGKKLF